MSSEASFSLASGSAQIVSVAQARALDLWPSVFGSQIKDHRYYEMLGDTLNEQFNLRCLVLRDLSGTVRAIQPLFVTQQDLMATASAGLHAVVGWLRRVFPGFLQLRMLMVGCPAGEGFLGCGDAPDLWVVNAMHEALEAIPKALDVSVVVLKDFPGQYRDALRTFSDDGYERLPSMPSTRLRLEFSDFEEYMSLRLSRATRKSLRRKFRHEVPLTMEVHTDISAIIDEVYPLYLQVFNRSALKFERLTPQYLIRLGKDLPDRARFFVWRLEGRAVAFSVCLVTGDALHDEYLGLDYAVALKHHLYFRTFRDLVNWSVGQGLRYYYSTPLGYDPKLHLGFELTPLDLYARHRRNALNPFFRRVLRVVGPTSHEPLLEKFPNAHEL